MFIQVAKFKSGLSAEETRRVMEERAEAFRQVPGLVQKYYLYEEQTGEHGAVYIFDSRESWVAFRQSALARSIAAAYDVQGQPRVEFFDVLFPLV